MKRLAELLLNKTLDECSIEELQRITDKYPYFNAGHLLAATKIGSTDTAESKTIIQKAGLHFHPEQLSFLINNFGNALVIKKEITEPAIIQPQAEPEIEKIEEIVIPEPETSTPTETEIITGSDEKIIIPEIQQASLPEPQQITNEQPATNSSTSSEEQPALEETLVDNPVTIKQDSQLKTPDSELIFEAFHTVDYFASQGIKVKLEDNPPDKFTKQLKSFTEWLKTMKKLPVAEVATLVTNENSEKKVEQLAEVSLTDSNVVTEAMAEVWVKQGNTQKAIEIYHKLSLLEPDKSPYFASRISDLKNN